MALLLVLLQSSGDGYFRLCSSKSNSVAQYSMARTETKCTQCHTLWDIKTPVRYITGYTGHGPHTCMSYLLLAMLKISKRSKTMLRSWHFLNIKVKQTLLIPKLLKIEAKQTLLIHELKGTQACVSHQWCDLFSSTTAQLYATHRKSGRRRKRHYTKCTGLRPCWRSLRQMRVSGHAGRSDVIMAPPPPIVHVNRPESVIFKKSG